MFLYQGIIHNTHRKKRATASVITDVRKISPVNVFCAVKSACTFVLSNTRPGKIATTIFFLYKPLHDTSASESLKLSRGNCSCEQSGKENVISQRSICSIVSGHQTKPEQ